MLESEIPNERCFVLPETQDIKYGSRNCCSRTVYTVDDEGFEEDGTVGRGAGPFVNHSYSRSDTPGETTQESEGYEGEGETT